MKYLVAFFFIASSFSHVLAQNAALDSITKRYTYLLLHNEKVNTGRVDTSISKLNTNGQWIDLDYANSALTDDWHPRRHLNRLLLMIKAWATENSPYYHQINLKHSINLALNHWLEKPYINTNWWHNEIGTPQYFKDIIILYKSEMTSEQLQKALKVLRQHKVAGTGANLIWSADLGFHYGLLTTNASLMDSCSKLISNEIKISTNEGIQPDYSFHQHGPRLQIYQYGSAFLNTNVSLAWELRGTPWAFPKEKITILNNYVVNAWQWMARGVNTAPGTIDRSVSRPGKLKAADIRNLIPYLIDLSPEWKPDFQLISDRQNEITQLLTGFKHYPYSDFTAYHTVKYSFLLKTISNRTLISESINQENVKGRLLNNGDGYLIKDGNEYYNLMPLWDWEHIPGLTNSTDSLHIGRQSFTGGVNAAESGLTAMDYKLENAGKSITAHKFWANHMGITVCLISNIQTQAITELIFTTLDQSRWRGNVTINRDGNTIKAGYHALKNVNWIHHAGFTYVPLSPAAIDLSLNTASGSWSVINISGSTQTFSEKIFMPVLKHVTLNSTGYVLAAQTTAKEAELFAANPVWKVIQNDSKCNAVEFKDGVSMLAFFLADKVSLNSKNFITVNRPCLVVLKGNNLYVSDPLHLGGLITIHLNHKKLTTVLQKDGSTQCIAIR